MWLTLLALIVGTGLACPVNTMPIAGCTIDTHLTTIECTAEGYPHIYVDYAYYAAEMPGNPMYPTRIGWFNRTPLYFVTAVIAGHTDGSTGIFEYDPPISAHNRQDIGNEVGPRFNQFLWCGVPNPDVYQVALPIIR